MKYEQYSVEVLVNGRPVREFTHYVGGKLKTFIEGRAGTRYSLKVTNRSCEKLLAIASVDGLNVVTGDIGDGFKGRGYIVAPYSNVIIKGFRVSDSTVGSFEFTSKHDSYAAEKGMDRNVGVIACNLINEKPKAIISDVEPLPHYPDPNDVPWGPYPPYRKWNEDYKQATRGLTGHDSGAITFTSSLAPISTAGGQSRRVASLSNFDMGTKFGEAVEDKIIRKSFDKNVIVASFEIYYASRAALEGIGIKFYEEKEIDFPQGFEGYCKPPKGWR